MGAAEAGDGFAAATHGQDHPGAAGDHVAGDGGGQIHVRGDCLDDGAQPVFVGLSTSGVP
ncbi:hypothetical protein [Streptomyces sp. NBC_00887]|uniref:hypothetical protein n=1 Tax=Streptomyces sp. NBC_00887 TaxID=2975859 RepID=UPI00386AD61A|nr:hypothetical protein OG844_12500 [Streptomyces sp. NBC_00887]